MSAALILLCCGSVAQMIAPQVHAWGNSDKVLLEKVTALTLEQGKMTNGRRSAPVPQLKCVGGSAGCSYTNQPRVVQCHNRGFDGYDVQWECKAELDSKYQFGKIQVSCEGYEYPDDPYVLRGSCGLEYELDLTQHGENSHYHKSYHHDDHYSAPPNYHHSRGWSWGGLLGLAVVGFILYRVLKGCFGGGYAQRQGMATGGTYAGSQTYSSPPPNTGGTGGGWGGFWTGAATGGTLGYLFGNRGRGYGYGGGGWGGNYGPSWGGGGYSTGYRSSRPSGFGGFGGGGSSSRSRTSSGFGGTSRR